MFKPIIVHQSSFGKSLVRKNSAFVSSAFPIDCAFIVNRAEINPIMP